LTLNSLWLLLTLVPFAPVIRYGVVAREEAYLERNFDDVCRYRARGAGCASRQDGAEPGRSAAQRERRIFRRPQRACFRDTQI
jgi:hypothetical protein